MASAWLKGHAATEGVGEDVLWREPSEGLAELVTSGLARSSHPRVSSFSSCCEAGGLVARSLLLGAADAATAGQGGRGDLVDGEVNGLRRWRGDGHGESRNPLKLWKPAALSSSTLELKVQVTSPVRVQVPTSTSLAAVLDVGWVPLFYRLVKYPDRS